MTLHILVLLGTSLSHLVILLDIHARWAYGGSFRVVGIETVQIADQIVVVVAATHWCIHMVEGGLGHSVGVLGTDQVHACLVLEVQVTHHGLYVLGAGSLGSTHVQLL